jgi:hypothetical protein
VTKENKNLVLILVAVFAGVSLLLCCPMTFVGLGLLMPAVQQVRVAAERAQRMNDLTQVGQAIHNHFDQFKKMPETPNDLAPLLNGPPLVRLQSGEILLIWKAAPFAEQNPDTSKVVIGWDAKIDPGNKRIVLFMDGAVAQLDEAAFNLTPKAIQAK